MVHGWVSEVAGWLFWTRDPVILEWPPARPNATAHTVMPTKVAVEAIVKVPASEAFPKVTAPDEMLRGALRTHVCHTVSELRAGGGVTQATG